MVVVVEVAEVVVEVVEDVVVTPPSQVCGTDGHSYINLCYLRVEHCLRGVDLSHYGACGNTTQVRSW